MPQPRYQVLYRAPRVWDIRDTQLGAYVGRPYKLRNNALHKADELNAKAKRELTADVPAAPIRQYKD